MSCRKHNFVSVLLAIAVLLGCSSHLSSSPPLDTGSKKRSPRLAVSVLRPGLKMKGYLLHVLEVCSSGRISTVEEHVLPTRPKIQSGPLPGEIAWAWLDGDRFFAAGFRLHSQERSWSSSAPWPGSMPLREVLVHKRHVTAISERSLLFLDRVCGQASLHHWPTSIHVMSTGDLLIVQSEATLECWNPRLAKKLWAHKVEKGARFMIGSDRVFGFTDERLWAWSRGTGRELWAVTPEDGSIFVLGALVGSDPVIVLSDWQTIVRFAAVSGKVVWTETNRTRFLSALISSGGLFLAEQRPENSAYREFERIDPESGKTLMTFPLNVRANLICLGSPMLLRGYDDLGAVDLLSGELRWRIPLSARIRGTGYFNGRLLLAVGMTIQMREAATGKLIARHELPSSILDLVLVPK